MRRGTFRAVSFRRFLSAALASAAVASLTLGLGAARAAAPGLPGRLSPGLSAQLASASPTDSLRVLVNGATLEAADSAVEATGMRRLGALRSVGVAVAVGTPAQVRAVVTHSGVETVEWADQPIAVDQNTSHTATRAAEAATLFANPETGLPYDGSGVGIMIIDSGVDATHPMFLDEAGDTKVKRNLEVIPLGNLVLETDEVVVEDIDGDNNTDDVGGHGTHVASIAAGYATTTNEGIDIVGSAPGADLYAISTATGPSTLYGIAAATDWTVLHHAAPCGESRPDCAPIRVVNNSWGGTAGEEFDPEDTTTQMQRALIEDGVVVVRSSGNSGGDGSTSTVTGGYKIDPMPGVITVANYDDANSGTRDGAIASSSSRGAKDQPNTWPDISAPGSEILGACRIQFDSCTPVYTTPDTDPDYGAMSGTSMAAPHIAGYVALLFQADPGLTPRDVEFVLEDTAYQFAVDGGYTAIAKNFEDEADGTSESHYAAGHGLVDVTAALAAVLGLTDPGYDACSAVIVTDPQGDAAVVAGLTDPAIGEGTPTPEVDIVSISAADTGTAIRFAIEVDDLGEIPAGNGDAVRSFFSLYGIDFTLDMNRQATNSYAGKGTLSRPDPADPTGVGTIVVQANVPVVFDPDADIAYADLDPTVLGNGTPVGTGDYMSNVRTLWRRSLGAAALPADEAAGSCPLPIS